MNKEINKKEGKTSLYKTQSCEENIPNNEELSQNEQYDVRKSIFIIDKCINK